MQVMNQILRTQMQLKKLVNMIHSSILMNKIICKMGNASKERNKLQQENILKCLKQKIQQKSKYAKSDNFLFTNDNILWLSLLQMWMVNQVF